jgi:6-phosphofructokinase 2
MTEPKQRRDKHIVTLTMNPALDVSTSTPKVEREHKLRCGSTRLDPGGGGINVARVVQRLGGHADAIIPLGGPTGHAYRQLLEAEGILARVVPIEESTRESFTVDETDTGGQFRFVLEGPTLTEGEWRSCLDALAERIQPGGFVVGSGSLPPGVPEDFYASVAELAAHRGARCIIDTAEPWLGAALDHGVFLVKPSRRELSVYLDRSLETTELQVAAATELVERGAAEYVALTLGGDGAVLAGPDGVMTLPVPEVRVQSTVGAGDSFLGALVTRLSQRRTMQEAFIAGVAAGSATAMTPATELCHRSDVERLESELEGSFGRSQVS